MSGPRLLFEQALRSVRDPALADFAARSTPVGEVLIHRRNSNLRHRFEKCRDWPAGLLVVGDSFVSFNPVFGQGIAVAALDAIVIRNALHGRRTQPTDRRRTRIVLRRLARTATLPWAIAVGQDLRQPTSVGRQNRLQKVTSGWVRELGRQSARGSIRAELTVNRLFHMVDSPVAMLHPALLAAGARDRLRRRGGGEANPRPSALDLLSMVQDEPAPMPVRLP